MTSNEVKVAKDDERSYEQFRIDNIIRNNAKLRELGLISEAEEKKSNLLAQGIEDKDEKEKKNSQPNADKKRKRQNIPTREGSRKSRRLQKLDVDIQSLPLPDKDNNEDIEIERIERVKECREARLRAAKAVADAGAEIASKENPTASYEHCLMRVKTMTPKKLETRVSQCSVTILVQTNSFFVRRIVSNILCTNFHT